MWKSENADIITAFLKKGYNKPVSKRGLVYEAGYALSCKRRID